MKFLIIVLVVSVALVSAQEKPLEKLVLKASKPLTLPSKILTPVPSKPVVPLPPKPLEPSAHEDDLASVPILKSEMKVNAEGFNYAYETGNGISAQANGYLKKIGEESALVSDGSYQYISPEGVPVLITYIADENGFQPQGDLLPTPPPVPEPILRLLEYLKIHGVKEEEKN